jgi:hypothetical protein
MTGEMSKADVTEEAYPLHFAIAKALGGEVKPFDMYQGPYVVIGGDFRGEGVYAPLIQHLGIVRLWIGEDGDGDGYVFNEANDKQSQPFPLYPSIEEDVVKELAVEAAKEVL